MKLNYVAHSEIGLVRKNNQDSGYASPTMLVVADGMGGAAAGDLASAVAISELRAADAQASTADHATLLAGAVQAANTKIAALVADDESLDGMGSTVCGGMFDGTTLTTIHIGDSRAYLLRDGQLRRLTTDHTWVQSLVDDGKISAEDAMYHPHRSLLLKVVNGHPSNTCDEDALELQVGDRLLFCSDGLCGLVEDSVIADGLARDDLEAVLDALIEAAHGAGGLDNITLVVSDVVADDAPAPRQPLLLGAAIDVKIPDVTPVTPDEVPVASPVVEDPEDARYRPIARSRRRHWGWLLALLVGAALIAAAGALGKRALDAQYYLGAADDVVTVYRGTPDKLGPLGYSSEHQRSQVHVSDLPPRYAEQVSEHYYKGQSLDSVNSTVAELDKIAKKCVAARLARAQATTPPAPSPTAVTPAATPKPTATTPAAPATPAPTPGATVRVTPSLVPTSIAPTPTPTAPPAPDEC